MDFNKVLAILQEKAVKIDDSKWEDFGEDYGVSISKALYARALGVGMKDAEIAKLAKSKGLESVIDKKEQDEKYVKQKERDKKESDKFNKQFDKEPKKDKGKTLSQKDLNGYADDYIAMAKDQAKADGISFLDALQGIFQDVGEYPIEGNKKYNYEYIYDLAVKRSKNMKESLDEGWKKITNVKAKDATSKVKEIFADAKVRRGSDEENEYVVDGKVVARYNALDNMLLIKEATLTPEEQKKAQLKQAAIEAAMKKYPNLKSDDFDYDETTNTVRRLSSVEKAKLKTLKVK